MENIPIDIHYNKLLDWLVDRRHCNLKWQQSASVVKDRIRAVMKEMPSDPKIDEIMSGLCVNYFACLKIMEILKASGEGSKNIFGQYSSQRMKDWADILQSYQNDNVHLAEAAHLLTRNVNYEIPSLKRTIGKSQQTQRDCTRKESEYLANAAVFKEKYYNECKQMGVKGDNVTKELLELVDELPSLFQKIAEMTKNLEGSITYYSTFVDFILKRETLNGKKDDETKNQICPIILFICKHGNATVYEWRTGKTPKDVRKEKELLNLEENIADTDEIDWGTMDATDNDIGEIDFGIDSDQIDFGDTGETIDFGDSNIDLVDTAGISIEENGAEIDFGIETIENAEKSEKDNDDATDRDDVAIGTDALSVLENTQTRNLFIDELIEIQSFLYQRFEELSSEGDILSAKQFQSAPTAIQMQSKDNIDRMLSTVSTIIDDITSTKMQNLYRLKSSPHYVHRLADSLQQKLKTANNLLRQAKAAVERKENAHQLQIETEPKLQILIQKTKELQKQIAGEISKKYKNRPVNVMGEINTI